MALAMARTLESYGMVAASHTWAFELTHEFRPPLTQSYEFRSDHDSLMS
jgi:hypothetical protein